MSGHSSASDGEDRVLAETSPHLCELYRGQALTCFIAVLVNEVLRRLMVVSLQATK